MILPILLGVEEARFVGRHAVALRQLLRPDPKGVPEAFQARLPVPRGRSRCPEQDARHLQMRFRRELHDRAPWPTVRNYSTIVRGLTDINLFAFRHEGRRIGSEEYPSVARDSRLVAGSSGR